MRYFIELSYNGKEYHGWQIQPDAVSVQEVLERTLTTFFRKEIKITGAGRTDTGVHAKQIFAHFDFKQIEDIKEAIFRLNSFLPKDIAIKHIFRVKEDAHARFDATQREYQYFIINEKNPFEIDNAFLVHQVLDVDRMNEAASILLTYKDFQCFSRSKTDVKTYHCDIKQASWQWKSEKLVFTITADRFLRNMVRAVVGTLLEIGLGKMQVEEMHRIIESKNRGEAGASVPAHGLYLTKVVYPKTIHI
ncbi:MAG: tRNA pseudouridine(38-40) synthase TruA [Flavobacteriaceae bacterium]|nr:tRNA pseudouridine(38-40) synthase TruA [Flavobacteriaceae bacterium]